MEEKPIDWRGSSLRDIKDDDIFTPGARREAGRQLGQVQAGLEPDHWKPFDDVGAGTKEIIINLDDGWFRVAGGLDAAYLCLIGAVVGGARSIRGWWA